MHGIATSSNLLRLPRLRRPALRRLGFAALALAILLAAFLWARDSSLVEVRQVVITGVSSSEEARVREALRDAATSMTTLHVEEERLREAVAPFVSVAGLRVDADFPHTLVIEVVERLPAAVAVSAAGERMAVAADGRLLRGVAPETALPLVGIPTLPAGPRLTERRSRALLTILGGAPPELLGRVERARTGRAGLQLELRDGPDLIFGSDARVAAKWQAAARVLADSGSKGALYLDLRLPERTAAGGVGPVETGDPGVPAPPVPPNPQP